MIERRFFCPDLMQGMVVLPPVEAHHAASVLRVRRGDPVILFDGCGVEADATVSEVSRREVRVQVSETRSRPFELKVQLTLAVSMIKAHRQNYMIEKCTELGVFAIQPLITERGVVHASEAGVEKWRRRAIDAARQSRRAWLPLIHPPASIPDALAMARKLDLAVVADLADAHLESPATSLSAKLEAPASIRTLMLFIGPEGGWTAEEQRKFAASGVAVVTMSPTVLRTETAAIAACAAVAMHSAALD